MLHLADGFHLVEGLGGFDQGVKFARHFIKIIFADLGDVDLLVECGLGAFQVGQDFFVEFLALTESRVLALYYLGDRRQFLIIIGLSTAFQIAASTIIFPHLPSATALVPLRRKWERKRRESRGKRRAWRRKSPDLRQSEIPFRIR